jgi:transposase InsO family protein
MIRLLDGTRAYLYAVIDSSSRKILASRVSERFDPGNTVAILVESSQHKTGKGTTPTLLADQGVENVNPRVDRLMDEGVLRRVLAQTEVACSNSLIESWWRTLKHQWLYLTLSTTSLSQVAPNSPPLSSVLRCLLAHVTASDKEAVYVGIRFGGRVTAAPPGWRVS